MGNDEIVVEVVEGNETEIGTGISTGAAMLIGSCLTLGIIAGVKKVKKLWTEYKASKQPVSVEVIDAEKEDLNPEDEN